MFNNQKNLVKIIASFILFIIIFVYIGCFHSFIKYSIWEKWVQVGIIHTVGLNCYYYSEVVCYVYGGKSDQSRRVKSCWLFIASLCLLICALTLSFSSGNSRFYIHYMLAVVGILFCFCDYYIATTTTNPNKKLLTLVYGFDMPVAICLSIIAFFYLWDHLCYDDPGLDAFVSGSIAFQLLFATFTFDPSVLKNEGGQ